MILVTGAGGTVGTALVEQLKAQRHAFRAAYHSPPKAEKAKQAGVDAVALDFGQPGSLAPALAGIDAVFLLGTGIRGQVERELNVVDAARAAGVRRLVKLSSWGAADGRFLIARFHREVESAIEASGLAWTFLRPNGFMQNFLELGIASIRAIHLPAADARISHIDARDIARVAARVLTTSGHEGKAYELSGPHDLSYREVAGVLSRVLGTQIRYVALTDDAARAHLLATGMPDFHVDHLIDLFRAYRDGAGAAVTFDVRSVTGRDPVSFEQFVRDHADALRAGPMTTQENV